MTWHGVYLHGFASGPGTAKGVALGRRLAGCLASYTIPDLEGGDFRGLTMDGILDRAEAALAALPADGGRVLLIGSSLGGYTAAHLAATGRARRATALLLIAPAFGFTSRWAERLGAEGVARWHAAGAWPFYHHVREREELLGSGFLTSCERLPDFPADPGLPVAIVHGRQDETVDHRASVEYARRHPLAELHLVHGDHRLTDPRHEDLITWVAKDLMSHHGDSTVTPVRQGSASPRPA
jgi:pimeloyl-ACP methyl ester carboxylesterase